MERGLLESVEIRGIHRRCGQKGKENCSRRSVAAMGMRLGFESGREKGMMKVFS